MENEITLQTLSDKLDSISKMTLIGSKSVLDLEDTAFFTGLSKGHLYRLTSAKEIPHFKKNRKLYFKKSDLERWLLDNPCLSNREVNSKAATYVSTHKKR